MLASAAVFLAVLDFLPYSNSCFVKTSAISLSFERIFTFGNVGFTSF